MKPHDLKWGFETVGCDFLQILELFKENPVILQKNLKYYKIA